MPTASFRCQCAQNARESLFGPPLTFHGAYAIGHRGIVKAIRFGECDSLYRRKSGTLPRVREPFSCRQRSRVYVSPTAVLSRRIDVSRSRTHVAIVLLIV